MKRRVAALLTAACLALPTSAQAAAWCTGTVSASWVDWSGHVYIMGSWRGTHTEICNLSATWKGISPEICGAWMAKVDAAVSMARQVTVYYSTETDCSALPSYTDSPAPTYVMLL